MCVNGAMRDEYLAERGVAYRVNDFKEGRPTLVFVHGLSGSCSAWLPFEQRFENTYNIVTYDLRGHGMSARPKKYAEYALEYFIDDLAALLWHLQCGPYVLVSHSFGTLVALGVLRHAPKQCVANIFLSPNFKTHAMPRTRVTRPFVALASVLVAVLPVSKRPKERVDYTNFHDSIDWDWHRIIPEVRAMTVRCYLYCLRHIYAFRHDEWWGEIATKTLILQGKNDSFVPVKYGMAAAKEIPNAQLTLFEHANHMLVLDNVGDVAKAIENFIK